MSVTLHSQFAPAPLGQHIRGGEHQILSDVAESLGGKDQGMDPHALLGAALAACTGMTLRMVAERKKWPLEDVHVTIDIDHAGARTHIVRHVRFIGALNAEQTERLLAIADKCPIHSLLTGAVTIATTLQQPQG